MKLLQPLAAALLLLTLFPPSVEFVPLAEGGGPGHSLVIGWIYHFEYNDFTLYFYVNHHQERTRWVK